MPLRISLPPQRFFTHSTSFQLSVGSNWPAIHCESVVRLPVFGMRPSRLPNDLRFPLSTFNAQDGFPSTSRKVPSVRRGGTARPFFRRSEEHTSELQSHHDLVCRLLLEKK